MSLTKTLFRRISESMIRPCPNMSDCPDDVFGNLSVEEPDPIDYISTQYASFPPPLIPKTPQTWSATECGVTFVSTVSQLDADMQAAAAAILCNFTQENPGVTPIFNEPQGSRCCVKCPDGNEFCYTAPPIFAGLNPAQANALAHIWACKLAKVKRICLNDIIPTSCCKGVAYMSNQIIADGAIGICTWTIEAGALPDGIFMGGVGQHIFTSSTNKMTLSGTPTVAGAFQFTLRCTDENGSFMQKVYTITVNTCSSTLCTQFPVYFVDGVNGTYNPIVPWNGQLTLSYPGAVGAGGAYGVVNIACNGGTIITIQLFNNAGPSDWKLFWFWTGDFVIRPATGFFANTSPFGGYQWVPLTPPPGIPISWDIGPC